MKIAFLGDSITLGYGLKRLEDRYSARVCRQLGASELNLGITGTLIARSGAGVDRTRSFLDRWEQLIGADAVVIFGGTNDYFWSEKPIFNPGQEWNEEYFCDAVDALFQRVGARFAPSQVLIITPYSHRGTGNYQGGASCLAVSEHDTDQPNFTGHVLGDYARVLRKAANRHKFRCADLFAVPFDWRQLTADGCHPNPEGHQWICERVIAALGGLNHPNR